MSMKNFTLSCLGLLTVLLTVLGAGSCANIIPPGGGPRDTIPPVLVGAVPKDSLTFFKANKIVLTFDEYIQLDNPLDNIIVSPNPVNAPEVTGKLKTVTIKLRDSLLPNTTYSINFGNALKDVNEGNIRKNFTYLFSTGSHIDDGTISGKVLLARTGRIDSTLIVVLQSNLNDSAIVKDRPLYYTRLDGKGNFQFHNLPAGTFAIYALPNDYTKRYDDSTKLFAFLNEPVQSLDSATAKPVTLYAYQEEPLVEKKSAATTTSTPNSSADKNKKEADKRLKYATSLESGRQDLLGNLQLNFIRPLKTFDSSGIRLTDTNYHPITGVRYSLDTSGKSITLYYKWPPTNYYRLVIDKAAVTDTLGINLPKSDTLGFVTKSESDYGSIRLRFPDLDLSRNPVLQLVQNNVVVDSSALTGREWYRAIYRPGEYGIRILFDSNRNGTWDPGKFLGVHKQPEIVQAVPTPLNIKADWENEAEIKLTEPPPGNKRFKQQAPN